jgi:hypothetical protein
MARRIVDALLSSAGLQISRPQWKENQDPDLSINKSIPKEEQWRQDGATETFECKGGYYRQTKEFQVDIVQKSDGVLNVGTIDSSSLGFSRSIDTKRQKRLFSAKLEVSAETSVSNNNTTAFEIGCIKGVWQMPQERLCVVRKHLILGLII